MQFEPYLVRVRKRAPLIHAITNYITANDCANLLLACGASPVMADDPLEAEDVTALCDGLALNIGTLSGAKVSAMLLSGKKANALGRPVALDPVGAGGAKFRTETALRLLREVRFTAIRGNVSEIKALAHGTHGTRGVDANEADIITDNSIDEMIALAQTLAKQTGAVIAVTGQIDIVADGSRACLIRNGHPMMASFTGSGCMLTVLIAAFLAANPGDPFAATAAAVCAMGVAGEIAHRRMQPGDGNSTYRNRLIDAVFTLTGEALEQGANFEIR